MKKFLVSILIVALLCGMFANVSAQEDVSVYIDGQKIEFDVNPQIIDGRTMVPMRKIFEKLGATVDWDKATQTATGEKNNTVVKITINNKKMKINGNTIDLDVAAQLLGGRTMVPVRAISESFSYDVLWEQSTKSVLINTKQETEPANIIHNKEEKLNIGYDFITLLDCNNNLYGWGNNDKGQLILGEAMYDVPTKIASDIKKVQCGLKHTLVLTVDGKVYCYGDNTYSQHGGQKDGKAILEDIIDISSSNNHCIALDKNGTVFCWGENQFGINTQEETISTPVALLKKVKKISTIHNFCMYVLEDGTLYATGDDMSLYKVKTQKSTRDLMHNEKKEIIYVNEQKLHVSLNLVNKNIADIDVDGEFIRAKTKEQETIYYNRKHSVSVNKFGKDIPYTNWRLTDDGEMWINSEDSGLYINSMNIGSKYPYMEDVECAKYLESGTYVVILKDGSVWTFGKNNNGSLGDSTVVNNPYPNKIIDAQVPLEAILNMELVSTDMFTDGYTLLIKFTDKSGETVKPTGNMHIKIYDDSYTLYKGTVYVYNKLYNKDNLAEIIIPSWKIKKASSKSGNVDIIFEKAFCKVMCSGEADELPLKKDSSSGGGSVYITPSGIRYHFDPDCGGKNSYGTSLKGAKNAGYTPCQKCAQ